MPRQEEKPAIPGMHKPQIAEKLKFPSDITSENPFSDGRFRYHPHRFEAGDDFEISCGETRTVDLGARWDQCKILIENSGECDVTVTMTDATNDKKNPEQKGRLKVDKNTKKPNKIKSRPTVSRPSNSNAPMGLVLVTFHSDCGHFDRQACRVAKAPTGPARSAAR